MTFILDLIERHGGIAHSHVHIKKDLWGLPTLDPQVVAAQRAGGRLACVSALAFHGIIERRAHPLHICAPDGVLSWRPRGRTDGVVRHWSRRRLPGDRQAVDVETAWAQFALCRGVSGRDVRLRRTDSL